ncbi:hypothetical protein B0H34DRAFT_526236 [Crassisporium funariophilum]|nr:hypothetical protein B0H34DRAFT_526236 [Crassisporium funariophilum]
MHDGFEMVARIPYPITVPKFYAIASEVATLRLLRSYGLPVPELYGYSPSSDNAAKTEYIFMEFMKGTKLSDVFTELERERERSCIVVPKAERQGFVLHTGYRYHVCYGHMTTLPL